MTPEQYDEVRKRVNWEGDVADGAMLLVATFDTDGARTADAWESQEAVDASARVNRQIRTKA